MSVECWNAEDYYNQAIKAAANSEISKAIYYYTESIYFNYQVLKSYKARAELFLNEEQFENALADYNYLATIGSEEHYSNKIAICYEGIGDYSQSLKFHLISLLEDIHFPSYVSIYKIVKEHPEFAKEINFTGINHLIKAYCDETKAIKFKEAADEFDLDQRNDFFDLYISLLPENSEYLYDAYIQKAKAEVFRYRICYDKAFREELKVTHKVSESQLNEMYKYNAKNVSELNIVYAVQKFNEATRYAKNLDEVNYLDNEVKKLIEISEFVS